LISSIPPDSFYLELLELLIPSFLDKSNPIHEQFEREFRTVTLELSKLFNDVLESGLDVEAIDRYYLKFEQCVKDEVVVDMVISRTYTYWYHFVKNVEQEASAKLGDEAKEKCQNLSGKLKTLFKDYVNEKVK